MAEVLQDPAFWRFIGQLAGALVLVSITLAILYQFNWRERPVPGYLEEWDMMADFEADTRSLEERLEEQRRLLKFQGYDVDNLVDDQNSGVKTRT